VNTLNACAAEQGLNAQIKIADDPIDYPFACDLSDAETLAQFPQMPKTDLKTGIVLSLKRFQALADQDKLS
jgi:hypothetical protein